MYLAQSNRQRDKASLTKTQIDRLGDRLRQGQISESDLRLLDSYRRSFAEAYETAIRIIRDELGLQPTGRPAKSTTSIVEKLRRESIRLTQMQDIAGCRVIVADLTRQDITVREIVRLFERADVVDRREHPSYGYRAVHVVVSCRGSLIEVQVRTSLQHLWAELSEKLSDVIDPAIKYGGGNEVARALLTNSSRIVARVEIAEQQLPQMLARELPEEAWPDDVRARITEFRSTIASNKAELGTIFGEAIRQLTRAKGAEGAVPD